MNQAIFNQLPEIRPQLFAHLPASHPNNFQEDEVFAYKCVRKICASPAIKIAQNGLYDVQYLFKYQIPVVNFLHDTMLLHHSLYPALQKGLDFLGSIYANDRAWKRWRVRGGDTHDLKRDE